MQRVFESTTGPCTVVMRVVSRFFFFPSRSQFLAANLACDRRLQNFLTMSSRLDFLLGLSQIREFRLVSTFPAIYESGCTIVFPTLCPGRSKLHLVRVLSLEVHTQLVQPQQQIKWPRKEKKKNENAQKSMLSYLVIAD